MLRMPWRRASTETVRIGPYVLRVEVLHAGTRSEGRIGRLYRDDREVPGTEPGAIISVEGDDRVLVYLGEERPHLWSVSGWTIDDRRSG